MKKYVLCFGMGLCLALCGCNADPHYYEQAQLLQIKQDAPVKAQRSVTINASADQVWDVLINAQNWPSWFKGISEVRSPGLLEKGTLFQWHTNGVWIESHVAVCDKGKVLAWSGHAFGNQAIHIWQIESKDSKTILRVQESISGPFAGVFYSSDALSTFLGQWLDSIKETLENGKK